MLHQAQWDQHSKPGFLTCWWSLLAASVQTSLLMEPGFGSCIWGSCVLEETGHTQGSKLKILICGVVIVTLSSCPWFILLLSCDPILANDYEGDFVEYLLGKEMVYIILKKIASFSPWKLSYENEVFGIGVSILSPRRNRLVAKTLKTLRVSELSVTLGELFVS